jgi:hypothetical protein
MRTDNNFAHIFLELKMFLSKLCRKSKHKSRSVISFFKHLSVYDMTWKNTVECVWNLMAHGDAREGKWRGDWRMEWVASTLHTTSEHDVSSITTADAHTSAAGSRLNWRPRRFKWTRPFRRKTKSGFCACSITFQTQSTARQATDDNVIWRMRFACWINEATDTIWNT